MYQEFYFITWPEAQKVPELDPDYEHSSIGEDGYFVEADWWDEVNG